MTRRISYADTNLNADCKVTAISQSDITIKNDDLDGYTKFYKVTLHFSDNVLLYLAKGYEDAPREICVWFPNGKMWMSYGKNFAEAIRGAHEDALYYM